MPSQPIIQDSNVAQHDRGCEERKRTGRNGRRRAGSFLERSRARGRYCYGSSRQAPCRTQSQGARMHGRRYLPCDSPRASWGAGYCCCCCAAETHKISPCPPVTQIAPVISPGSVIQSIENDSPSPCPVISLSNVALKDPLLPLHPPGDSLSHPGKQDRAARAPPCVCQWFVSGGGEPSSPRRMACQSCACQAGKSLAGRKASDRSSTESCSIIVASASGPAAHGK